MDTTYRVNYGQGQVSNSIRGRRAAISAFRQQQDYDRRGGQSSGGMFLQRYDALDREWVTVSVPAAT